MAAVFVGLARSNAFGARRVEPRTSPVTYGAGVSTFLGGSKKRRLVHFRASARVLMMPVSRDPHAARMLGPSDRLEQRNVGVVFSLGTELGALE